MIRPVAAKIIHWKGHNMTNISQQSHWAEKEIGIPLLVPAVGPAIELSVPAMLRERRIYLFTDMLTSGAGAWQMDLWLEFMLAGRLVGDVPAQAGDFTAQTPNKSVLTLLNAVNNTAPSVANPIGDSLAMLVAQPFATVTNIVIQPLRVNAEIDSVILKCRKVTGAVLTQWRALLAVHSSNL
jgi:hypothetical protein